jgi:DNA-directed RNA polymerase subunit beta
MADLLPVKSYRRIPVGLELPKLIQVQIESFERLKRDGFVNLFAEISPIESYNQGMQLYFPSGDAFSEEWGLNFWYEDPKNTVEECLERDLTYSSALYVTVLLKGKDVP